MKQISELPNHYASIEHLTLYRWDKFTSTKDNNWFLVDYDGRQKKIDSPELKEVEKVLVDEYFKAVDDRCFSDKLQKWNEIDLLKSKFEVCHLLLDHLFFTVNAELNDYFIERRFMYIKELKKWGLKFPELNSVYEDNVLISTYRTVLEGIRTQIGIIHNELQIDGQKEHKSLLRQLRMVELGLGYNYRLDPKKITVMEWIEDCKLLEEKAKQN